MRAHLLTSISQTLLILNDLARSFSAKPNKKTTLLQGGFFISVNSRTGFFFYSSHRKPGNFPGRKMYHYHQDRKNPNNPCFFFFGCSSLTITLSCCFTSLASADAFGLGNCRLTMRGAFTSFGSFDVCGRFGASRDGFS